MDEEELNRELDRKRLAIWHRISGDGAVVAVADKWIEPKFNLSNQKQDYETRSQTWLNFQLVTDMLFQRYFNKDFIWGRGVRKQNEHYCFGAESKLISIKQCRHELLHSVDDYYKTGRKFIKEFMDVEIQNKTIRDIIATDLKGKLNDLKKEYESLNVYEYLYNGDAKLYHKGDLFYLEYAVDLLLDIYKSA